MNRVQMIEALLDAEEILKRGVEKARLELRAARFRLTRLKNKRAKMKRHVNMGEVQ